MESGSFPKRLYTWQKTRILNAYSCFRTRNRTSSNWYSCQTKSTNARYMHRDVLCQYYGLRPGGQTTRCPSAVLHIKCWLCKWLYMIYDPHWLTSKNATQLLHVFHFSFQTCLLVINTLRSFFGVHLFFLATFIFFISFSSFLLSPHFPAYFRYSFFFLRIHFIISAVNLGHPKRSTRYSAFQGT